MKKILYDTFVKISLFLMSLSLIFKSHYLCALIIWLNLRKFKEIRYKREIKKRIIIFPKSGGNQDLRETYKNKESDVEFFLLPRFYLQKIFLFYFKNTLKAKYHSDYNTKPKTYDEKVKKELYVNFLTSTFKYVDQFFKFEGIISFNLFYFGEKYFDEVCVNLKKKFVVLHKESVVTSFEEKNAPKVYGNNNEKSLAHKISVYSKSQKKILIKSKIASENQITINGCPRSDYAFKLRKIKPKKDIILYYLIEYNRSKNPLAHQSNINWKKIYNQTLEFLIQFAKKNPNIRLILKGKIGVHKKKHFDSISFPKNCMFFEGGSGEKFLIDSTVIVGFNSSVVYETIASNRNLIIPNFNLENRSKYKDHLLNISDKKYFANSKKEFNKKLNFYLTSNYVKKSLSKKDKEILNYYFGNFDGTSSKKMYKFLNKIF